MAIQTDPSTTPNTEVTFALTGMTCAACVRRIEKALNRVQGVQEANVNLATEMARVVYDSSIATLPKMQAAIDKAGYGVRDFPQQPSPAFARALSAPALLSGEVTLPIVGMTCASCVRRIEKALNRVEGVQDASVNLATERAKVVFDPIQVTIDQMRAAVQKAGYSVGELPLTAPGGPRAPADGTTVQLAAPAEDAHDLERQNEIDDLKRKWSVSMVAGLAMMALLYLPLSVPMDVLAPVLLIIATAVQFWAAAPIYGAAWSAARHGGTNMHTLVAVGTTAAYAYSAFVTLWPRLAQQWGFPQHLYYETAVIIIALILMGRWLEARAKKQTGAAIKALMGLQARTARVIRDGIEQDVP